MNADQRNFIVGSEWIYYKIYTGTKTSETILQEIILPYATEMVYQKIIDKWFFVRYNDPDYHLRVRFHIIDDSYLGKVLSDLYNLFQPYVSDDLIWKIQLDTYQREVERYGKDTIEISERLFFYDSMMVAGLFSLNRNSDAEEVRWLFALLSIDEFLDCFKMPMSSKRDLLFGLRESFKKEFGGSKYLSKALGLKNRQNKTKIDQLFELRSKHPQFEELSSLLDSKRQSIVEEVAAILTLKQSNSLEQKFDYLLEAHIHMTMNRIFRSENRLHELVCYDMLYLYYTAFIKNSSNAAL